MEAVGRVARGVTARVRKGVVRAGLVDREVAGAQVERGGRVVRDAKAGRVVAGTAVVDRVDQGEGLVVRVRNVRRSNCRNWK